MVDVYEVPFEAGLHVVRVCKEADAGADRQGERQTLRRVESIEEAMGKRSASCSLPLRRWVSENTPSRQLVE